MKMIKLRLYLEIALRTHKIDSTITIQVQQKKKAGLKGFEPLTYGLRVRRYA